MSTSRGSSRLRGSAFDAWSKRTLVSIMDVREMTAQRISSKSA